MKMLKKRSTGRVKRAAAVVGLFAVAALGSTAVAHGDQERPQKGYLSDGQPSGTGDKAIPQFVKADGDHGKEGYINYDIVNHFPTTDAEWEATKSPRTYPLYGDDLHTQIDTFTVRPPTSNADKG